MKLLHTCPAISDWVCYGINTLSLTSCFFFLLSLLLLSLYILRTTLPRVSRSFIYFLDYFFSSSPPCLFSLSLSLQIDRSFVTREEIDRQLIDEYKLLLLWRCPAYQSLKFPLTRSFPRSIDQNIVAQNEKKNSSSTEVCDVFFF